MPYLYILFLSILFVSCSSVPKEYSVNNVICHYDDPIFNITKEELVLNKDVQKQLQNQKDDLIMVDNQYYKNRYYLHQDGQQTNKQTNKHLGIAKWITYRSEGTILWSKFLYLNNTKPLLKEIHYDTLGKITKVIDHEKGYVICWAEAIEIVKKIAKKEIKKYEITDYILRRVNINKWPKEQPVWRISLEGNEEYETNPLKVYWIDGVTGKFLKTTEIKMIP